jgi:hypothetical protein
MRNAVSSAATAVARRGTIDLDDTLGLCKIRVRGAAKRWWTEDIRQPCRETGASHAGTAAELAS